jgi:hypothetical protein
MELILHLGAHRTGTTALQQCLRRHEPMLRSAGIGVWGPWMMRRGNRQDYVPETVRQGDVRDPELAAIADVFRREFDAETKAGTQRLLVSDENFLGAMRDNYVAASLYPDARAWLSAAAQLFPQPPARIFLCVRDYASYAVSIYGHLSTRVPLGAFDADRIAGLGRGRNWGAVIGDIRAVFPDARITLWRYAGRSAAIRGSIAAILGPDIARRIGTIPRGGNRSPSKYAMIEILRLWREGADRPRQEVREAIEQLKDNLPGPRIEPFSPQQLQELNARFQADWDALTNKAAAGVDTFDPMLDAELAK